MVGESHGVGQTVRRSATAARARELHCGNGHTTFRISTVFRIRRKGAGEGWGGGRRERGGNILVDKDACAIPGHQYSALTRGQHFKAVSCHRLGDSQKDSADQG